MLTVGVVGRVSGAAVVALRAIGERKFEVAYRGSLRPPANDNQAGHRSAIASRVRDQVRTLEETGPVGALWVDTGSQETLASESYLLVGQVIGTLGELFPGRVKEVTTSTVLSALRARRDEFAQLSERHLGVRVGRNSLEDQAAIVALYGATVGKLALLRERRVAG